jgi:D-ribose pyranase
MKKTALINSEISHVIASLGHTDMIVIADAGLPISAETHRIDLDTLKVLMEEMHVEKALVSEEVKNVSPQIYASICSQLGDIPIEAIQHRDIKLLTGSAKAVTRTGEFAPYGNVILVSGA